VFEQAVLNLLLNAVYAVSGCEVREIEIGRESLRRLARPMIVMPGRCRIAPLGARSRHRMDETER